MNSDFIDLQTTSLAMDYFEFAPLLYNFCKQFGLQRRHMLPSSAFCSDEDQGYPLFILAKHFGILPIDIGTAEGWINYPEIAEYHDVDLVIVQATHIGDEPRLVHNSHIKSEPMRTCRYQSESLLWYLNEY